VVPDDFFATDGPATAALMVRLGILPADQAPEPRRVVLTADGWRLLEQALADEADYLRRMAAAAERLADNAAAAGKAAVAERFRASAADFRGRHAALAAVAAAVALAQPLLG